MYFLGAMRWKITRLSIGNPPCTITNSRLSSAAGHYMYIETSWPRRTGDNARFNSPIVKGTSSNCYLRFFYHMKGSHIGTLRVLQRTSYYVGGLSGTLWNRTGSQGDFWYRASVQAPYSRADFQFVIEGIRGRGYQGDIAIDDVSLSAGCQICTDCTMPGSFCLVLVIVFFRIISSG